MPVLFHERFLAVKTNQFLGNDPLPQIFGVRGPVINAFACYVHHEYILKISSSLEISPQEE